MLLFDGDRRTFPFLNFVQCVVTKEITAGVRNRNVTCEIVVQNVVGEFLETEDSLRSTVVPILNLP